VDTCNLQYPCPSTVSWSQAGAVSVKCENTYAAVVSVPVSCCVPVGTGVGKCENAHWPIPYSSRAPIGKKCFSHSDNAASFKLSYVPLMVFVLEA
jgi:hypothetical protein